MIFLSLMFIILYLSFLVKGGNSLINKVTVQFDEYNIKKIVDKHSISKEEEAEMTVKAIFIILFVLILAILEIVFLIKAIKIDTYLYPTLIIIAFYILNLLSIKSSKKYDLTTEEGRYEKRKSMDKLKHRTLKGTIIQFIYLGYFSYIFYILVFLNR